MSTKIEWADRVRDLFWRAFYTLQLWTPLLNLLPGWYANQRCMFRFSLLEAWEIEGIIWGDKPRLLVEGEG